MIENAAKNCGNLVNNINFIVNIKYKILKSICKSAL